MRICNGAVALLMSVGVAMASQDSAYYPGFSNPNVADDLYYREAVNVLQDLADGKFSGLYIKYHGCVWSEYGSGEDEHDDNTGCGGDGGDEHWYMGRTQCFRPNVAFTLYGVKHGNSVSADGACSRGHYINSFFTTGGIESFGGSVGFAYGDYGAYTSCTMVQGNYGYDDAYNNGNNGNGGDNKDNEWKHNQLIYQYATSYGLACAADGTFITANFQGAFCEGNHFTGVSNEFSSMNSALQSLGCMQVYNAGDVSYEDAYHEAYYNGNNNNNNNNNNKDEDNEQNDYAVMDTEAWYLLSQSVACSTVEYPHRCPDPYNIKAKRDNKLHKTARMAREDVPFIMPLLSTLMIVASLFFFKKSHDIRKEIKSKSIGDDPMDQARETTGSPLMRGISESFARTATGLSVRTRSIKEALIAYALEEEDDLEGDKQDVPPPTGYVGPQPDEKDEVVSDVDDDDDKSVQSTASNKSTGSARSTGSFKRVKSALSAVSAKSMKSLKSLKSTRSNKSTKSVKSTKSNKSAKSVTAQAAAEGGYVDVDAVTAEAKATDSAEDDAVVVNNDEVANAMLVEKGVIPPPKAEQEKAKKGDKKLKRPRLAKIARFLFKKKAAKEDVDEA